MESPSPTLTHYIPFNHRPDAEGKAFTVCERLILEKDSDAMPTCPRCAAYWDVLLHATGIR